MQEAAIGNNVHIIKYAVDNGGTNYDAIIKGAVVNNNIELLTWALENGANSNIILYLAAENGNYELLNFALKNGANKYGLILIGGASGGFIDLVKKYNTQHIRDLSDAVTAAATQNHLDIVEYLLSSSNLNEKQRKRLIIDTLFSAGSKNNLDIINWVRTTYGCSEECEFQILLGCCKGDNLSLFISIYNELTDIDISHFEERIVAITILNKSIQILKWILINIPYNYDLSRMMSQAIRTNSFPIMKLIRSYGYVVTTFSLRQVFAFHSHSLQTFVWLLNQIDGVIPYMEAALLHARTGPWHILQYCLEKLASEQTHPKNAYHVENDQPEPYKKLYNWAVSSKNPEVSNWALLYFNKIL
jgi:hypothetical protein